jgi:hypothetical protein
MLYAPGGTFRAAGLAFYEHVIVYLLEMRVGLSAFVAYHIILHVFTDPLVN